MRTKTIANLYIYYKSIADAKFRLDKLFNEIQLNCNGEFELSNNIQSGEINDYYSQLSISYKNRQEYWDAYFKKNDFCIFIDFETICKETRDTKYTFNQINLIRKLLDGGYIDIAKLHLVNDSLGLFKRIGNIFYFGKKQVILFHFFILKFVSSQYKRRKFHNKIVKFMSNNWNVIFGNDEVIKINIKDKRKYLKMNNSKTLLELINSINK